MILLTGSTGNVGRELVQQLLPTTQPLRVLVRDPQKVAHLDPRVERVIGDLDDPASVQRALQGVDRAYLMTRATSQDEIFLAAAKSAGVQHIVKLSTLEAGMSSNLLLGAWHGERETLLRNSGIAWTMLRPGQFMSNALGWVPGIKSEGKVFASYGQGQVAAIDPADIAAVAVVALTQPGHTSNVYQLTGPELMTTDEQVQTLARLLGKPIQYVDLPPAEMRARMLNFHVPPHVVDGLIPLMQEVSEGKAAQLTNTVPEILGRPANYFENWFRAHLSAFQ